MTPDEAPEIELSKDGPVIMRGKFRISSEIDGKKVGRKSQMLCRCGRSHTKPFCDLHHLNVDFDDSKLTPRDPDRLDSYVGKKLVVHDNRGVCSHKGKCTELAPDAIEDGREPRIIVDADEMEKLMAICDGCPSGAMSYTIEDVLYDSVERPPQIVVGEQGPYYVQGRIILNSERGYTAQSEEHYAICRCGHSRNQPFCDGMHWNANFGHNGKPCHYQAEETKGYLMVGKKDQFGKKSRLVTVGERSVAIMTVSGRVCAVANDHPDGPVVDLEAHAGLLVGKSGQHYTPYPWARVDEDNLEVFDVMIVEGDHVYVAELPTP